MAICTSLLKYGIRIIPCCVRDAAYNVLSQHFKQRVFTFRCNAIGLGQGGAYEEEPILRKQVQNCVAHGMAGSFLITHSRNNFLYNKR